MSFDFGKVTIRAIAVVMVLFGFGIGGVAVFDHIRASGEGAWAILPFALAGVCILFGALIIQKQDTAAAIDKLIELVPILGPLLSSRIMGGRRETDPPPPDPGSPDEKGAIEDALQAHAAKKPSDEPGE